MKSIKQKLSVFWFRRDLRVEDNVGLFHACKSEYPVLPLFIFDTDILDELPANDHRVNFIYTCLKNLHEELQVAGSSLLCLKGEVRQVWNKLLNTYDIQEVYTNRDYEAYAKQRDLDVGSLLKSRGIKFETYKDQLIFEAGEVLKKDDSPYTVFTPYKKQWLKKYQEPINHEADTSKFLTFKANFHEKEHWGIQPSEMKARPLNFSKLDEYEAYRDFPAKSVCTNLSLYLRFGSLSIRSLVQKYCHHEMFISELIWREFFSQILSYFPESAENNFKPQYNSIEWQNQEDEFQRWCEGKTGYPMVDAGMRELNATGYMHNRVRMVTASFLCKHLLIQWQWGESYFAKKLFDFELASNCGNWQWSAGTGCDAAPYFRVFNPSEQIKKFDPRYEYIKTWLPEYDTKDYPQPMVEHKMARQRAIDAYKKGIDLYRSKG